MVKLQDFAAQMGVTDRQIQRLIKKHEAELEGYFDRRGQNGTWISEEGCAILRAKMKVKEVAVIDDTMSARIKELEEKIERKDILIDRLQQRLEGRDFLIGQLQDEKKLIEEKNDEQIRQAVAAAEEILKLKLDRDHRNDLEDLRRNQGEQIQQAVAAAEEAMRLKLEQEHRADLQEKTGEFQRIRGEQNTKIGELRQEIDQKDRLISEYRAKIEAEARKSKWQRFKDLWKKDKERHDEVDSAFCEFH